MAELPSIDHDKLFNWETYDESRHPDDLVIWLSSDEEAPTLAQTAESFETMLLVSRPLSTPEKMALGCPPEDSPVIPDSARHPSGSIGQSLFPPNNSAGDRSARILFASLLPSHKAFTQFSLTRRILRVAALVSVLLIGSVLPSILGHLRTTRVRASAAVADRLTQSAGHPMSRPVRVLTVMAGRQETVKYISIRYVGHFDGELFEEIRILNPDLKDPDHLEDGQLIRIPLLAITRVN